MSSVKCPFCDGTGESAMGGVCAECAGTGTAKTENINAVSTPKQDASDEGIAEDPKTKKEQIYD
jgi:DnaJ-class molecular chaperone